MKLGHILQSSIPVHIELEHFRFDELKRAARFWVGKEAGSYSKGQCIAALTRTMNGDDDAQRLLTALSEKERQILPIFTRYGPTVPGGLLTTEVYDRGLVRRPPEIAPRNRTSSLTANGTGMIPSADYAKNWC